MRPSFCFCLVIAASIVSRPGPAAETRYELNGHVKARFIGQRFPADSIFNALSGRNALDLESDLRLNFEADRGPWSFDAAYQSFLLYGDRVEYSRLLPAELGPAFDRLPNDDQRLFDLTQVIHDEGKTALLHRLDRLSFGYAGEKAVLRVGRQAISWGNGLFFSPLDIVNPFDPTTIDTEYKAGDDMLYGQYLRDNGHDLQAAVVVRRDPVTGDVAAEQATAAIKYHGIAGNAEYDLLLAESFDDFVLGVGGNRSIGGAVWRADLVLSHNGSDTTAQLVSNLSHSWVWGGKNMSGVIEYYFNGFGQGDGRYDPASLAENPELLRRLARGEMFTLGRHYLAGGVSIELSPLSMLTPNLFVNLEDWSAFLQLQTQLNLGDNTTFLGALNVPIGPAGTEYGGIETGTDGQYLSTDFGIFAQIAWYF